MIVSSYPIRRRDEPSPRPVPRGALGDQVHDAQPATGGLSIANCSPSNTSSSKYIPGICMHTSTHVRTYVHDAQPATGGPVWFM